jgi:hypothetical protein
MNPQVTSCISEGQQTSAGFQRLADGVLPLDIEDGCHLTYKARANFQFGELGI